jgi:hypothetical protein
MVNFPLSYKVRNVHITIRFRIKEVLSSLPHVGQYLRQKVVNILFTPKRKHVRTLATTKMAYSLKIGYNYCNALLMKWNIQQLCELIQCWSAKMNHYTIYSSWRYK